MIKDSWEKVGRENPYFTVLTLDKYDRNNLTEEAREEFFQTGCEYINRVWEEIGNHFEKNFSPRNALDFGCGVGRLVFPLAKRADKVFGIDISEEMLRTAIRNSADRNVENAVFVQTEQFFAGNGEKFDMIHSTIVFQHIAPKKGLEIVRKLIGRLNEEGIGVLQFTYKDTSPKLSALRAKIYRDFPFTFAVRNFIKRRSQIIFPMYEYNLNEIFQILQQNDCHKCFVEFSQHGMNGVVIYFQKKKSLNY